MMVTALLATCVPMLIYIWAGFSRQSAAKNEGDYFLGGRAVSIDDYANTSVGYALQMAAIFLFAAWGILYGLGALWTAVFWAIGYRVLWYAIPHFEAYRTNHSEQTLHGFLRARFGAGRSLQLTAALATVLGLIGTMVAEVDYTVSVYAPVTGALPPLYFEAFFFAVGVIYIVWNGYKAEVVTERFQVPLAYSGLVTTLLLILPSVWTHSGAKPFWWATSVLGSALFLILIAKVQFVRRTTIDSIQVWIPIVGLCALTVETLVIINTLQPGSAPSVFDKPLRDQLWAQGGLGLTSLFLANGLWMIVDVSTWQRVAAIRGDEQGAVASIREATRRVMLE